MGVNVVAVVPVVPVAPDCPPTSTIPHHTLSSQKKLYEDKLKIKDLNRRNQNVDYGTAAIDGERTLRALPDLAHAAAPRHTHGRLQHADCTRPRE